MELNLESSFNIFENETVNYFEINYCAIGGCLLAELSKTLKKKCYCLHYLLTCSHSVCGLCLVQSSKPSNQNPGHLLCIACNQVTILDMNTQIRFRALLSSFSSLHSLQSHLLTTNLFPDEESVSASRTNQHLPVDRLLLSRLFSLGQVLLAKPIEIVQIDESTNPPEKEKSSGKLKVVCPTKVVASTFDRQQAACYAESIQKANVSVESIEKKSTEIENNLNLIKNKTSLQCKQLILSCHLVHSKLQMLERNLQQQMYLHGQARIELRKKALKDLKNQRTLFEDLFSEFWSSDKNMSRRTFVKQFEDLLFLTKHMLDNFDKELLDPSAIEFDPLTNNSSYRKILALSKLAEQNKSQFELPSNQAKPTHEVYEIQSPDESEEQMDSISTLTSCSSALLPHLQLKLESFQNRFKSRKITFFKINNVLDFYIGSRAEIKPFVFTINNVCKDIFLKRPSLSELKADQYYFAFSSKYKWCRCVLKQKPEPVGHDAMVFVQVYLIDFDELESVLVDNLRLIKDKYFDFKKYPPLLVHCGLWNVSPDDQKSEDILNVFNQFIKCDCAVDFHKYNGDIALVDIAQVRNDCICLTNFSLVMCLIEMKLAKATDASEFEQFRKDCKSFKRPDLTNQEIKSMIKLIHFESSGSFYVRLSKDQNDAERLERILDQKFSSANSQCFNMFKGTACLYRDEATHKLCRATITLYTSPAKVLIFLVDSGRFKQTEIFNLDVVGDSILLDIPSLAVHCQLYNPNSIIPLENTRRLDVILKHPMVVSVFGKFVDHVDGKRIIEIDLLLRNHKLVPLLNFVALESSVTLFDPIKKVQRELLGHKNTLLSNFKPLMLLREATKHHYPLPVIVTQVNGTNSFHVQIMVDEVQRYFEYFSKYLHFQCEQPTSVIRSFNKSLANHSWSKGQFACFMVNTVKGPRWLRGFVLGTDPRSHQVCVRDMDSGILYHVSSREMLKCPSNHILFNTGRFAFECKLNETIKTVNSINDFNNKFKQIVQANSGNLELTMLDSVYANFVIPVAMYVRDYIWKPKSGITYFGNISVSDLVFKDATTVMPCLSNTKPLKAVCHFELIMNNNWQLLNNHNLNKHLQTYQNEKYVPARMPINYKFKGTITHISENLTFSIQVIPNVHEERPICRINREFFFGLFKFGRLKRYDFYTVGMCVSAYDKTEGTWNRAEIIEVLPNSHVNVLLVDYGRKLVVSSDQISSQVFAINEPMQALTFKLHGYVYAHGENYKTLAKKLKDILLDRDFQFEIIRYDPPEVRVLNIVNQNPLNELIQSKLLVPASQTSSYVSLAYHNELLKRLYASPLSIDWIKFDMCDTYSLQLTAFSHRNYFWFQVNPFPTETNLEQKQINLNLKLFLNMQKDFGKSSKRYTSDTQVAESRVCLAFHQDTAAWARCLVTERLPDSGKYRVLLVDYGEACEIDLNDLTDLDPQLLKLPVICWFGQLFNIAPRTGSWSDVSVHILNEIKKFDRLVAIFKSHSVPYQMDIYEPDADNAFKPVRHALQRLVDIGLIEFCHPNYVKQVLSRS